MARRSWKCVLLGHKWKRKRRPDRTVLLTCVRCGHLDMVDRDIGPSEAEFLVP
ncbi:MAG: DUF1660 family phage protein [Intrasporangiaceae bacterium]|nr:DUF1660 family phage protein [Intrasporangiaceae bacterium]